MLGIIDGSCTLDASRAGGCPDIVMIMYLAIDPPRYVAENPEKIPSHTKSSDSAKLPGPFRYFFFESYGEVLIPSRYSSVTCDKFKILRTFN